MNATDTANLAPYGNETLPAGIRSRVVNNNNGLMVHVLEAGFETAGRPCALLLHGFPELAYSWRKVMLPLAEAGYHVIAPDQRGYGRTTGWDGSYDADGDPFRNVNMVRDAMGLVYALGYRSVAGVVGHDAGSPVASWCAMIRPDIFRRLALMSSPFPGPPKMSFDTANGAAPVPPPYTDDQLDTELAKLNPPRKYYRNHQRTHGANDDMLHARQGLHNFFRAYYHAKSADWKGNTPHPLKSHTAEEMAKMPHYYVMLKDKGMADNIAPFMPTREEITACKWLNDAELGVYVTEYQRTGFTGALQGYRVRRGTDPRTLAELRTFSGRTVDVPACFIAGKADWGSYQNPGVLEAMQTTVCKDWRGTHFVENAGHWAQQEQPDAVNKLLIEFLGASR